MNARDTYERPALIIGLVNNTSPRAMASTVGSFRALLCAADPPAHLTLRLFRPRELARYEAGQCAAGDDYADLAELFGARLDALIVTGMEPQAGTLESEPIWVSLTRIADWAEHHGIPTIWSCLAAHAATRHLDGITRRLLPGKLSGVFGSKVASGDHPVMSEIANRWCVPHSRYYDLPEQHLVAHGYDVLSRSIEAGVDVFYKRRRAPFVFLQGHPEYERDTLAREYKRDVRRYLQGEQDHYPATPRHYFNPQAVAALSALREDVLRGGRDSESYSRIVRVVDDGASRRTWRAAAARLFANWVGCVLRHDFPSSKAGKLTLSEPDLAGAVPALLR